MAKPIFLIGFPMEADNHSIFQVQNDLSQKLEGEYHVIAYKIPGIESIKFEVLNAINATDSEISELISKTESLTQGIIAEYEEKILTLTQDTTLIKNNQ